MRTIVVDTSVFVSACIGAAGASREALRRCLLGKYSPLMGAALFAEYEDVLSREGLFRESALSRSEREMLLDAFLGVCRWTRIYFLWRPNVRDESDNHLVELAVAGGAEAIVTRNVRDFARMELRFARLAIARPEEFLQGG